MSLALAWWIALVDAANPGLVAGWATFGDHAYALIDVSSTFDETVDLCDAIGMDVVAVTSEKELQFLLEAVYNGVDDEGTLNSWFWIGAYNGDVTGRTSAWSAAMGRASDGWEWDNGEKWSYQNFDGVMISDSYNYDHHGAALVVTDLDSAALTRWGQHWRISPANYYYKVVCETR